MTDELSQVLLWEITRVYAIVRNDVAKGRIWTTQLHIPCLVQFSSKELCRTEVPIVV